MSRTKGCQLGRVCLSLKCPSGRRTFPLPAVGRVLQVSQQLHEVAAQGGHDDGGVETAQAADDLNGQLPHLRVLVVQRHQQRPQAAPPSAPARELEANAIKQTNAAHLIASQRGCRLPPQTGAHVITGRLSSTSNTM